MSRFSIVYFVILIVDNDAFAMVLLRFRHAVAPLKFF